MVGTREVSDKASCWLGFAASRVKGHRCRGRYQYNNTSSESRRGRLLNTGEVDQTFQDPFERENPLYCSFPQGLHWRSARSRRCRLVRGLADDFDEVACRVERLARFGRLDVGPI